MSGRKPDYRVHIQSGKTEETRSRSTPRIGSAWKNSKDGINVVIDDALTLMVSGRVHSFTLWPMDDEGGGEDGGTGGTFADDEIPF